MTYVYQISMSIKYVKQFFTECLLIAITLEERIKIVIQKAKKYNNAQKTDLTRYTNSFKYRIQFS